MCSYDHVFDICLFGPIDLDCDAYNLRSQIQQNHSRYLTRPNVEVCGKCSKLLMTFGSDARCQRHSQPSALSFVVVQLGDGDAEQQGEQMVV